MRSVWHLLKGNSLEEELHIAIANNRMDEARELVKKGAKVNEAIATIMNGSGKSMALHQAASEGNLEAAKILVDAGADLEALNNMNLTPLMLACSCGGEKGSQVAIFLLNAGANAGFISPRRDKKTAMQFAAKTCTYQAIKELIKYGAEVDGDETVEQTPLMLAARSNNLETIKALVEEGADVNRHCQLPWAKGKTASWLAQNEQNDAAYKFLIALETDA